MQHFLLLPVDKGLRPVYLRRDAQGEFKAFVPLRFHSDAYLSVYGITGLHLQGHCILPARLHRSFHRHIEIEEYTVFFGRHRHLRNQGESPGTIGIAAVDVHAALLLTRLSASFQRTVLGNLSSVVFHRGEQGIVHRPFKLLDVERIARVAPQTAAELHVGERHASLHRMISRQSLLVLASIPALEGRTRTGNVYLVAPDTPGRTLGGFLVKRVVQHTPQFYQTFVAGHHLVSLLPVFERPPRCRISRTSRYRHIFQRFGYELRTALPLDARHDAFGKVEVASLAGNVIQIDHRFQDGTTCHAKVIAGTGNVDVLFVQLLHQVIHRTHSGLQCRLVAGQAIVCHQGKCRIFPAPDVPVGQPGFGTVVAYVAFRSLGLHETPHAGLYLLQQRRVLAILVKRNGPQQPLPKEFGLPKACLPAMTERLYQMLHILRFHPLLDAGMDASAYKTANADVLYPALLPQNRQRGPGTQS